MNHSNFKQALHSTKVLLRILEMQLRRTLRQGNNKNSKRNASNEIKNTLDEVLREKIFIRVKFPTEWLDGPNEQYQFDRPNIIKVGEKESRQLSLRPRRYKYYPDTLYKG